jgi:hypothetical protein
LKKDNFIHHFPGRYVSLRWESPDEVPNEVQSLAAALNAIEALRIVVQPLAVDFEVVSGNHAEIADGQSFHSQLRVANSNSTVAPGPLYEKTVVTDVAAIDRLQLEQWTKAALASANDTAERQWTELRIRATCARLSDSWEDGPNLMLLTEAGLTEVPVDVRNGVAWVCGPVAAAPDEPPIDFGFFHDSGVVTLKAHLHWSAWTEIDREGRAAFDQALDHLEQLDWAIISSDLPGAEFYDDM